MDNQVRDQLHQLIRRFGVSLCEDPKRLEGMLKDVCPTHKKETRVLISALSERIAEELLHIQRGIPVEMVLHRLTERLHEELAIKEEAAQWAVDTWALVLGVIRPAKTSGNSTRADCPGNA